MKVIYGLGNPGRRYDHTRHNAGFMVADHLSKKWGIPVKKKKAEVLFGIGKVCGIEAMIAKPQTYMNLSGLPLSPLRIVPEDLIVIHDDMDISLGQVRVKKSGGTGGHKGLDSIKGALCSGGFLRVRFGIGRPVGDMDPSDYVLEPFHGNERDIVQEQIEKAAAAIELCIKGEITKAMNVFNKREKETSIT